jgi:C_GCAxxG_C_C family probable redox protein
VILAVGQEKAGIINEDVIKAMGAFGGGIASTGRVCGALIGGVAVISTLYSRGNVREKEDPRMWRLGYKLTKTFEALTASHGGVDCRDIARVDWRNRDETRAFYTRPDSRRDICVRLVGDFAYALGQILEKDRPS